MRGYLGVLSKRPKGSAEPFLQCANCRKILFADEFERNLRVCPHCGHHHRLSFEKRIEITFDPDSFMEADAELRSADPLDFPEYAEKLRASEAKTGRFDSVVTGRATIDGRAVSAAVADFSFMGGSMGSVAGEKITRTLERAVEDRTPALIFCASGGARMQEGLYSLMQMAKTVAAVGRCRKAGVLASYASVADVILAEPKALVGFAGARVSKQAGVGKVPDDFQTAEFVVKHGMLDRIVERKDLRDTLGTLVRTLGDHLPRAVTR